MTLRLRYALLPMSLLLLTGLQSCHKDTPAIAYDLTSDCFKNFSFVRAVNAIEATVVNGSDSSVYGLQLTTPLQIDNRQIKILSACNLPTDLKKVGQRVIISGRLLDYNLETANWYYIFGQPFVLTAIKTA